MIVSGMKIAFAFLIKVECICLNLARLTLQLNTENVIKKILLY